MELDESMLRMEKIYCCPPFNDALARDAGHSAGATLIVREGRDGALYFKITNGDQEATDANVNEPVGFCPFCGRRLAGEHTSVNHRSELLSEDEELTVIASAPTLILARG